MPNMAQTGYRTREDTMRAVRRLFTERAASGIRQTCYSAAGLAAGIGLAAAPASWVGEAGAGPAPVIIMAASGISLPFGLWHTARFSTRRLRQVLAAYQQGEPLPAFVRRRLKPRYFGR